MARCSTRDAGRRGNTSQIGDAPSRKVHPKIVEACYWLVNFKRAVMISPSSACR
jgi:hypothetical protein